MAQQMQDIKRRMKSIGSTEHITNAMRLVSSAKFRKAKENFDKKSEYFHFVTDSIGDIFHNADEVPEEYLLGSRPIKTSCYILITSCSGLCGSFNANVIKALEEDIREADDTTKIVAIGSKGKEYFERRGYEIVNSYESPSEDITFLNTHEISKPLIEMYERGEIDEIVLVYTSFVNTLKQEVKSVRLLPFDAEALPEVSKHKQEVDYEPSLGEVFNYMVPKYAEVMIYGACIESATCEHAARRTSMENATKSANDMLSELSMYYNRARQAAITNELIEIVSGSEAQK
ncbi:MAG TPA: ATP synthase F1 subunit gamma [Anaerovoracaceae bacterium]|nr:ATP synthase F1 subunit gamma [Anaerovoracaceae bacterium]